MGELYQAMDVFVMPSLFEGLPVVGVEAQFSGLPCIFSDKVPEEVEFTNKVKFVPLNDEKKVWANIVIAAARVIPIVKCRNYGIVFLILRNRLLY